MNVVEEVLREHSKAMCERVVRYVGTNPKRFAELVNAFLGGPYRVTQRSGWPLTYCVERHPNLIKPHLKKMIGMLKEPGLHNSARRNIVRFLQYIDIPRSLQGKAVDACFGFLTDPKEEIAVKVFSMSALARIAEPEPGLRKELAIIIEDQLPYSGPGFTSRARKVLKKLKA